MRRLVDLSQPIRIGQVTHPGLPAPQWEAFRSRGEYHRATGTTFQIDRVVMVGNTGTYLDSPFHRYADGPDLASLALAHVADLATVVVDARGHRAVTAELLADRLDGIPVRDCAVLLHTEGDTAFETPPYAEEAPLLSSSGAGWLAERRPVLVGIDAVNVDALENPARPRTPACWGKASWSWSTSPVWPASRRPVPGCTRGTAGVAPGRHLAGPRLCGHRGDHPVTRFLMDVAGWFGAGCLLSAYVLVSSGRLPGRGLRFQLLNLLGAVGLLINGVYHGAWPSAGLNSVWLVVGLVALVRLRPGQVPPPER